MNARSISAAAFAVTAAFAVAQDRAPVEPHHVPAPDAPVEPVKPAIERIDATHYRVGAVAIDSKTREIRFPAEVNMSEGVLEYLLVRTHGKIHESLLVTATPAVEINLAFTLLGYPASPELYALPNNKGGLSSHFPKVPAGLKEAARVRVSVEWDDHGNTRTVPVNEWIQHGTKADAMPETLWVYGGSEANGGQFAAETTGDIAAIFLSNASLLNYPGKDNADDTVWFPYPKRVPPPGTKVTVVISPNPVLKPVSVPEIKPETSTPTDQPQPQQTTP